MSDIVNVHITETAPTTVTVEDGGANRVVITEEQAGIIQLAMAGLQGPPGTQIIDGIGEPSVSAGRLGDYYVDKVAGRLWGPKTTSGWGTSANFGGIDTVEELEDVDLAPLSDQEALMWDALTGKWRNQRIRYLHTQSSPGAVWTIEHGLNTKPSGVSVFDTSGTQSFGEIQHLDENSLSITFSAPFAGVAYVG